MLTVSEVMRQYVFSVCVCMLQVRTKTARQCVEFYYMSKKILDKQKKLEEEENRDGELEQRKSVRNKPSAEECRD